MEEKQDDVDTIRFHVAENPFDSMLNLNLLNFPSYYNIKNI